MKTTYPCIIRKTELTDIDAIYWLYKEVSKITGGLARIESEITSDYIRRFTEKSATNGLQLLAIEATQHTVVGEIHAYLLEPQVFKHVLSDLTIAVHPDYQAQGIGKMLFTTFLNLVAEQRNDILRVELIARESNQKAIAFYQQLGFKIEGRLEKRIYSGSTTYEADIPMAWFEADIPMAWFNNAFENNNSLLPVLP